MSVLVIAGSARSDGNTGLVVERLNKGLGADAVTIDLATRSIEPFRYDRTDDRDDFRSIVREMLAHPAIVLATPVYWYAMSGLMKMFFDRLTDLLIDEGARPIARSLAGRRLWVLATGTDEMPPSGFDEPFARTAAYFCMDWSGSVYVRSLAAAPPAESEFAKIDALAARILAQADRRVAAGVRSLAPASALA